MRWVLTWLATPKGGRKKEYFSGFLFVSSLLATRFFSAPLSRFPKKLQQCRSSPPSNCGFSGKRSQGYLFPLHSLLAGDRVEARHGRDRDDDADEHDAAGDDRLHEVLERRGDLGVGRERGRERGSGGGGDGGRDLDGELLALGAVEVERGVLSWTRKERVRSAASERRRPEKKGESSIGFQLLPALFILRR